MIPLYRRTMQDELREQTAKVIFLWVVFLLSLGANVGLAIGLIHARQEARISQCQ